MSSHFSPPDCDPSAFEQLLDQTLSSAQVPGAADIQMDIPLYDVARLRDLSALRGEWAWVLGDGPGVLVLRGAITDHEMLDRVTAQFNKLITAEKAAGATGADHFAASGANDRLWNALQKLGLADPALFARYFACPAIAAVAEAWLGPGYQVTAQVNLVRPGGAAQSAHRDYHLGFMGPSRAALFPKQAHHLTAALTLQGGIAHCNMPVVSGPTKLLPYSQLYGPGYLAFHDPAFRDIFEARHVQLALSKGDALFFNPALFHAAGENRSADIHRMVNLLQISSAFGRAMESVNRVSLAKAIYPALQKLVASGALDPPGLAAAIAASAEGYAFPSNLDTDPPSEGRAPESQAELMHRALADGLCPAEFAARLDRRAAQRTP